MANELETLIILIAISVLILLPMSIKVLREYERAVKFRIGRYAGVKGPGLFVIIPGLEKLAKVDLRTLTLDVPKQRIITKDNVSVNVDAVVYIRVVNPNDAIMKVERYIMATSLLAQTTLRDILGQSELDDILSKREELNTRLQKILDEATDVWGIKVSAVTIRDVSLPEEMLRAIAKQAEAEREGCIRRLPQGDSRRGPPVLLPRHGCLLRCPVQQKRKDRFQAVY